MLRICSAFGVFCLAIVSANHLQAQPSAVVARAVVVREVNSSRRVVGDVIPLRNSTVGSAVDGRVEMFHVKHGEAVEEGQPLAQLRTGTLEIELAAAQAQLRLNKQQLAELDNGSLPQDIAEALAKKLAAEAVKKNTAARLERTKSLSATSAVTQDELGDAIERAEAARQLFLAAEAAHQRVVDGPRPEIIAQAEAQVALQEEQIKLIEDRISKHTIVAPFAGFVAAEYTEKGAWIQQGDPIVDVIQLNKIEVRAPVPAEQALALRVGQQIRVEFPERQDEVFVGTLRQVVPLADQRTRTFPVYITLENRIDDGTPRLMAGMLARVDLPTGQRQAMPLVPKDAIVLNGDRQVVLVIDGAHQVGDTGTVRAVPVELGVADEELIQVRGDLKSGELVVVLGNERLNAGTDVAVTRVQKDRSTLSARDNPPVTTTQGGN